MNTIWTSLAAAVFSLASLTAAIVESPVAYDSDGAKLEGLHYYDDAIQGPRPAVLVIHQWMGITDHEKQRSRKLAELGFNVFAADVYGAGIRPATPGEAGKEAGKYKSDRQLFRNRLAAGLDVLRKDERSDPKKIAAIGFCFGGTAVLELARAGTEMAGVISFHGGLDAAENMQAKKGNIPAKVLVLHGAVDPHVPMPQVQEFQKEMEAAGADWQLIAYGGAVHAFTQQGAGNDASKGAAYNASADARSWAAMLAFFKEIFGTSTADLK